ncbi:arsenite methyltransferase [Patella vulgata]|uniref:arsenite methyltransferase n=1 Tax=Patella vulgata TaxID=6465 RepID=UPI0024A7E294|nr:arsenite methyltransferase [Patella vulgata]
MTEVSENQVRDSVKDYYGKTLKTSDDLQTPACSTGASRMSKSVKKALGEVHDEVTMKYYGCGLVIPEKVEGTRILDLGSGSGRDCFALSKLVGEDGAIVGLDMTDEQLAVSRKYIDYHREKFGYKKANTEFVKGYIEKIVEAGLKEETFDIIVSNCVVNLSPDKKAVLSDAYKVLKVGGELYFSDIYADHDVPESARKHEVLWGECISGALWWKELYRLAEEIGFSQPRLVAATPVPIEREDFKKVLGDAKFASVTYRLFKLPEKREAARQVIYNGDITDHEKELKFDFKHSFKTGEPVAVDEELSTILTASRFKDEFDFQPCSASKTGCCPNKVDMVKDPFVYMTELESSGETLAPACCPTSDKKCC